MATMNFTLGRALASTGIYGIVALGMGSSADVISEIESIPLDDLVSAMDAVTSLLEDPSTTLVLRRPEGPDCETLVYGIEVR